MQPLNFSFKCLDCGSCYNYFDKLYVAAAVEFLCTAVQLYSVCVLLYFLGLACAHCCTVCTVCVCVYCCTVVLCVRPVCVYCCTVCALLSAAAFSWFEKMMLLHVIHASLQIALSSTETYSPCRYLNVRLS